MNPFDLTETAVLCTYAQHYIRTIQLLMDDVIVASSDDIDGIAAQERRASSEGENALM